MKEDQTIVNNWVLEALETALQHEAEFRLVRSAKKPGLLPNGRNMAAKEAIAQCRSAEAGLFTILERKEGKGKDAEGVEYAAITPRGIRTLFEHRTPDHRNELMEKCANPHKEKAQEILLNIAEREMVHLNEARSELECKASSLRTMIQKMCEDQLVAIDRKMVQIEKERREVQRLSEQITQPRQAGEHSCSKGALTPEDDGDIDFQIRLCRELVFAWQEASSREIRDSLEPALLNSGLDPIGRIGEIVSFDNREHRTDCDLLPGQPAEVVECGWQLTSPRGTRMVSAIQVKQPNNKGTVHATHVEH